MIRADGKKTRLKLTSYTNVEIQNNAYRRGGECLLTSIYYDMKPEKRIERLTYMSIQCHVNPALCLIIISLFLSVLSTLIAIPRFVVILP
jgi:hypothetical protein